VSRIALLLALALLACRRDETPPPPSERPPPARCLADAMPPLTHGKGTPTCTPDDMECRDACLAGDAPRCYGRGVAIEGTAPEEAYLLQYRGCELGLAIACTNAAAYLWARSHDDETTDCAARIFVRACDAGETFACGMYGRMVLDNATTPDERTRGRQHLRRSCDKLGGFSCRVLALHLETGKLGPTTPAEIQGLLARACDDGDPDACGSHATASETFD
jgi:hypothetical protein